MTTRSTPVRSRPSGELTPDAAAALRQFRIVVNAVRQHFRATERKAGLSGAQTWALSEIARSPGTNVRDLARAMDVHQSTVSNLLRELTSRKLVAVERDGADKRAVNLFATIRGQKALSKAPAPYAGVLPAALMQLDAAAVRRLNRDLAKLVTVLDKGERGALIPLGEGESKRQDT